MSTPYNMVYKGNGDAVEVNNATNILKTGVTQSQQIGDDGFYQKGGRDIDYSIDDQGVLIKVGGQIFTYTIKELKGDRWSNNEEFPRPYA